MSIEENGRTPEGIQQLIERLGLQPHPEGGRFREFHRSACLVWPEDGRGRRSGLTAIWFLLAAGGQSAPHKVTSDEAWHWCGGAPLELLQSDAKDGPWTTEVLGPLGSDDGSSGDAALPVRVVPAGCWQAARPLGDYSLVCCTVGPGFDFADFSM